MPPTLLRNGVNMLAVEVHQSSGASSDVGFDLALDGEYPSVPQPLQLDAGRSLNQVAITWPQLSVGHVLQSTTRLPPTNQWSAVTSPVGISGTNQRVVFNAVSNQFFRLRNEPVDASTLSNKLLFGYQAWFACTNDGSPPNRWVHWFRSQTPVATNATVDFWPDISELEADELFATGMTLPGGE